MHESKVTNPSSTDWFEKKATEISARLMTFIKEAGGYHSEFGSKFGFILHEINGTFGSVYNTFELLKGHIGDLEKNADQVAPDTAKFLLAKMIARFRLEQTEVEHDGWFSPSEADDALVDDIIKAGWVFTKDAEEVLKNNLLAALKYPDNAFQQGVVSASADALHALGYEYEALERGEFILEGEPHV